MKMLLAVAATVFCLSVAIPASAHHMAEGIVSVDVYEMIEENLEGSPHLELDLTSIGSMAIMTVEVMEEDVPEVLDSIGDALTGTSTFAGASGEGDTSRERSTSLEVDISLPTEEGLVTITILEKIGQGASQVVPDMP